MYLEALELCSKDPQAAALKIVTLEERLHRLEQQVEKLTLQKAKNSKNSSKPPSTDGFKKPKPKSLRKKTGRKPGGQKGHKGSTLKSADTPDVIENHCVTQCECCKKPLEDQVADEIIKRQVFDIPRSPIFVTEHRSEEKTCSCGHPNKAGFPEGVNAPVQYGELIQAVAVYLNVYQMIPYKRTCEVLSDLLGCEMSEGTLHNLLKKHNERVQDPLESIRENIRKSNVAHFDETGFQVGSTRWWLHVASTQTATYYQAHPKRGCDAMNAIDILPRLEGRAIHDHWKPYYTYLCKHGLCNAHHLRELVFVHEEHKQPWAEEMIGCLMEIKIETDRQREHSDQLPPDRIREFEELYQRVLEKGYAENPLPPLAPGAKKKRGRRAKSKPRNLLERLDGHREEALAFMYDLNVPFDNNLGERDIRMTKVKQKISGTCRSEKGAEIFCNVRSYISTAQKNSIRVFDAVLQAVEGNAFTPECSV
jgi:transposase